MALTLNQAAANILYGGGGRFWVQEFASDGAVVAGSAMQLVSLAGKVTIAKAADSTTTNGIKVKSNDATEYDATRVYTPTGGGGSSSLIKEDVTIEGLESDVNMLSFWEQVRGKYFAVVVPLGKRNGFWVVWCGLVSFADEYSLDFDGATATTLTIKGTTRANTAALTLTLPTDGSLGTLTTATIAAGVGRVIASAAAV